MDVNWEFGVHTFSTSNSKSPRCENYEAGEDYDYSDDDDDGDYDEEDVSDTMSGLACPFCSEDFDVLGLCCHIDVEHLKEAKASKFRNGGTRPALSFSKKELQDEYLSTPSEGSSPVNSSAAVEIDSLFLPFFYNPQLSVKTEVAEPSSEASEISNSSQGCDLKSGSGDIEMPTYSNKVEEKNQRCEFIQGLLLSMILEIDF